MKRPKVVVFGALVTGGILGPLLVNALLVAFTGSSALTPVSWVALAIGLGAINAALARSTGNALVGVLSTTLAIAGAIGAANRANNLELIAILAAAVVFGVWHALFPLSVRRLLAPAACALLLVMQLRVPDKWTLVAAGENDVSQVFFFDASVLRVRPVGIEQLRSNGFRTLPLEGAFELFAHRPAIVVGDQVLVDGELWESKANAKRLIKKLPVHDATSATTTDGKLLIGLASGEVVDERGTTLVPSRGRPIIALAATAHVVYAVDAQGVYKYDTDSKSVAAEVAMPDLAACIQGHYPSRLHTSRDALLVLSLHGELRALDADLVTLREFKVPTTDRTVAVRSDPHAVDVLTDHGAVYQLSIR